MQDSAAAELIQKAYEMALATKLGLDAHIASCDRRSAQLIETVNLRHESIECRLKDLGNGVSSIQTIALGIGGTLILSLFSIIGILLHNGGHF